MTGAERLEAVVAGAQQDWEPGLRPVDDPLDASGGVPEPRLCIALVTRTYENS